MIRGTITLVIVFLLFQCCSAAASVHWISSVSTACWVDKGVYALQPYSSQSSYMEAFPDSQFQKIDGFGGCFNELEWTALNKLSAASRDSVIMNLFDTTVGCRYNMGRMPIGANDYSLSYYSHDDSTGDYAMSAFSIARHQQYVIPFIKAAMKYRPDLRVWGSPWTPPAWMKTNANYAGGAITWTAQNLQAYALYLEKCVLAYQAAGLNFFALFVQNEPYSNNNYPTCPWTSANLRDFIKLYLGPKFASDNVPAQIWLSTINNVSFSTAVAPSFSDSVCRKYISGVGYQWEGYKAMGTHYKLYPTMPFWQTETKCGSGANTWAWADSQFMDRKFAFDSGAAGFFEWNMVLEKGGKSNWGWVQSAMISIDTALKKVTYNPEYYVSKHFSYFVNPNARYIKMKGTYNDKVAFINPNGDIVLVVRNSQASSSVAGIKVDNQMFLPTIPAHSYNTFVFSGVRSSQTSVIPHEVKPGSVKNNSTITGGLHDIAVFNVQGKKLLSMKNVRKEQLETKMSSLLTNIHGAVVITIDGKKTSLLRRVLP